MKAICSNIVIFGASGFLGGHIRQYLYEKKSSTQAPICLSVPARDFSALEQISDLSNKIPLNSTVIVASGIKRQIDDSLESLYQNISIIRNLCNVLRGRNVAKLIYFSSAAVYGEDKQGEIITEGTPLEPSSYYGIAKRSSEEIILRWSLDAGIKSIVILRPTLVFGLADKSDSYGPTGFLAAAQRRKPIVLWGDGTEQRDFIYINDIGYITTYFLTSKTSGIFNLCTGRSRSYVEILDYLRNYFPDLESISRDRTKPKTDQIYSPSKLLSVLPSQFVFTSMEDALDAMIKRSPQE